MQSLVYIVLATLVISLGGLIGVVTLAIDGKKLAKILLHLISLSAGALMGGAFLHLLPEASEKLASNKLNNVVLASFILFYLIEKLLHWRHCHKGGKCDIHTFGYMNLVGDSVHNFIDGLIIAGAFITDINLGIITTLAVALHEIPQEIGDFGVLLYSGFSKRKALTANFLVALTSVLGGLVGYYLSTFSQNLIFYLLPFAAGGFIYIAASDLMPEIRKEQSLKKSAQAFGFFVVGILIMYFVK
jgi:zinc and cadmium transporter